MFKSLRVLLCEDDYLVSAGIKRSVESFGHTVIDIARDGKEAIELALKYIPDLIFMDINMPIINGLAAMNTINEKINIPFIILTAYYNEELIDKASEYGALYYLIKPVTEDELSAAINIVLARHEDIESLEFELDETRKKLEARKYIDIAKGRLMDNLGLSEHEAMKKLQQLSRDNNLKLVDVAKKIMEKYKIDKKTPK